MDLVGIVINAVADVAAPPVAVALSIITSVASDVKSDSSDPYWNDNTQLYQTVATLKSNLNTAILDLKASLIRRFSACTTDPMQLRMLAATLPQNDIAAPSQSDIDSFIANQATPILTQRLVRLLFASKWNVCQISAVYNSKHGGSTYLNCQNEFSNTYNLPYDRWYPVHGAKPDIKSTTYAGWICPDGKYDGGTFVDLNVYGDAGEFGHEEFLVQSTLSANIYRDYTGTNQYQSDGWSAIPVSKCPSDCGKPSC
eukprot:Opistho-2@40882